MRIIQPQYEYNYELIDCVIWQKHQLVAVEILMKLISFFSHIFFVRCSWDFFYLFIA